MNDRTRQEEAHTAPLADVVRRREAPNTRPRDAATLIVVDRRGSEPRVLMGRRHHGLVFMPGKFVFPGGRVERCDHTVTPARPLSAAVEDKLLVDMKGGPNRRRAQALALAALRETFEETGLLIGGCATDCALPRKGPWRAFLECGVAPRLDRLALVARAITPPRLVRRYDTRFFAVDAGDIAGKVAPRDGELLEPHWLTLAETQALDLPPITRVILDELAAQLARPGGLARSGPVPYYLVRHGRFERRLI